MSNIGKDDQPLAFELNFTVRRGNELVSFDKILGADLITVLSQLTLVIALVSKKICELRDDDDIPF